MKKLILNQGTAEWLSLRNNKIGASDAPIILGLSPWKTPYQLWQIKMGLVETPQTQAMKRGIDLEPIARQKFIEIIGCDVFPIVALHDDISFMLASFDGVSENGKIVVEIKCPGREDHEKAMDGIIPEKYIPQLQHQMEIANVSSMFYFSYSERSYKMIEINKDNAYIKDMISKEKDFWDCMQNLEAPNLIDKDYIQREDEEWLMLAKEWIELCRLEQKKEEVRMRLLEISGKSNTMGGGIKLSKIPRKGNVDYKSIPELQGINLDKYRKSMIETYRIGVC